MVAPIIPLTQTPIQQIQVGVPQVVALAHSVPSGTVETQRPSPPPDSEKHRLRDEDREKQKRDAEERRRRRQQSHNDAVAAGRALNTDISA